MSIWDFLKRKKEVEKAKSSSKRAKLSTEKIKQPEKEVEKVSVKEKTEELKDKGTKEQVVRERHGKKKEDGFSYDAVKEPHISEKGTNLGQENKYIFKIQKNANKPEVKKAVEGIYGVDVLAVNIIKIPKKKRRIGRTEGFKKGYTKAVVTIKEGQKIEIL